MRLKYFDKGSFRNAFDFDVSISLLVVSRLHSLRDCDCRFLLQSGSHGSRHVFLSCKRLTHHGVHRSFNCFVVDFQNIVFMNSCRCENKLLELSRM